MLLEYALKKEKLLLGVRKSIDIGTLIDLITFGLPNYIADKIDRETLQETEDLYNEIGKYEYLVGNNRKFKNINTMHTGTQSTKYEDKKPCQICVHNKKGKRYHPEENCWFQEKHQSLVKTVNNSELEIELNEKNPKN
jgi:hypothetical protein